MPRIVLDTNVLVSAFLVADGRSADIIHRILTGKDRLFLSQPILDELRRVLINKLKLNSDLSNDYLDLIRRYAVMVAPTQILAIIETDETDNRILECAVTAEAEFIVSGDRRHVLPLVTFQGIRILSPTDYLEYMIYP